MSVIVVNRHTWKGNGTYVGRGTVFGNPWTHMPLEHTLAKFEVDTREEAIEKYREHLQKQWVEDPFFRMVLSELVRKHMRGEEVVLACSCAPKPCHADVLKELILAMADLGVALEPEIRDPEVEAFKFDGEKPF